MLVYPLLFSLAHGYLQLDFQKSNNADDVIQKRDLDPQVALVNEDSVQYNVQLLVGSPPQNISVQLDTGSSDLWFVGSDNPYCKSNKKYAPKKKDEEPLSSDEYPDSFDQVIKKWRTLDCIKDGGVFNSSNSTTYKSNDTSFLIYYGDGSFAKGGFGTDVLQFGDFNISNLTFGVANFSNSSTGILGVGLPLDEATYNVSYDGDNEALSYTYPNFPMVLKQNGVIDKIAYSVYLNNSDSSKGSILFGAVDHSKYSGDLITLPIARTDVGGDMYPGPFQLAIVWSGLYFNDSQWIYNVTNGTVGKSSNSLLRKRADDNSTSNANLFDNSTVALLDTGTTLTYVPDYILGLLMDIVNGTVDQKTGAIKLKKCPKKNDYRAFTFEFDNAQVTVPYKDLVTKHKGKCYLQIGSQGDDLAILGDNFLTNAYVVYDLEDYEISIAQANYAGGEPQIEEISGSVPSATRAAAFSSDYLSSAEPTSSSAPRASSNRTNSTRTNGTNQTNETKRYLERRAASLNAADSLKSSGYVASAIVAAAGIALFL